MCLAGPRAQNLGYQAVCRDTALQQPNSFSRRYALPGVIVRCPAGIKGGSYSFSSEKGPDEVFARFFGTLNPYEALQGECDCLQPHCSWDRQLNGTAAVQQGRAPLHDSCLCTHP